MDFVKIYRSKRRVREDTPFDLSSAIVAALTRTQKEFVEAVTTDVWHLEQRVTGDRVGEPVEFLNDLFRARHGLLAIRTVAALSAVVYARLAALTGMSPGRLRVVTELAERFASVREIADGEREYLQGVIEFYQTVLVSRAALVGQAQNEEVRRLTTASYAQKNNSRRSPRGPPSSSRPRS